MNKASLSWNDRLALIDYYKPTDDEIVKILKVTPAELEIARNLRKSGMLKPSVNLDVESYSSLFITGNEKEPAVIVSPNKFASKQPTTVKKRGRKGNNIQQAFKSVPTVPTPIEEFASDHNVSVAVLRQSKRFNKTGLPGIIKVKKDKSSGQLMIWRELNNE